MGVEHCMTETMINFVIASPISHGDSIKNKKLKNPLLLPFFLLLPKLPLKKQILFHYLLLFWCHTQ